MTHRLTIALAILLGVSSYSLDTVPHNAIGVLCPDIISAGFSHIPLDMIGEGSYDGQMSLQIAGTAAQFYGASKDDQEKMMAANVIDVVDKLLWHGFMHASGIAIQLDGPTTLAVDLVSIGYVVGRNMKVW